jgi:hypothetical protein
MVKEGKLPVLSYENPRRRIRIERGRSMAAVAAALGVFLCLAPISGFAAAILGEKLGLSDSLESMFVLVPIALTVPFASLLLFAWIKKSRTILLASCLACLIAVTVCGALGVLERFSRIP